MISNKGILKMQYSLWVVITTVILGIGNLAMSNQSFDSTGVKITYLNESINKDTEVANIFDELYFMNAPKILNYQLATTATMLRTGCVLRRPYDSFGNVTEDFKEECLWSENIENIYVFYDLTTPLLNFLVVFSPIDEESENTMYSFLYNAEKKELEINYRHNYIDKEKKIDSYKFGKVPDAYYEKYNCTRDELMKVADDILYNHLLPLYFDKNKEGGAISKFSIENLGEFITEYRF